MQKFIIKITDGDFKLIEDKSIECFILDASMSKDFIKSFAAKALNKDKITLVMGENAPAVCAELSLDGVIVDLSKSEKIKKEIADLKKQLPKKILGIITRNRRHEAMLVSEEEPDFVIFKIWKDGFESVAELVSWYSGFFLIQSAVLLEDEVDASTLKADIVILPDVFYKKLLAKK